MTTALDLEAHAFGLLSKVAAQNGINIDEAAAALELSKKLVALAVDLLDGHAKAKAEAAGKAAADVLTTEDAAEKEQRKP